jgi:hypothetical protein
VVALVLGPSALEVLQLLEPTPPDDFAEALVKLLRPFMFLLACAGMCLALGGRLWLYVQA